MKEEQRSKTKENEVKNESTPQQCIQVDHSRTQRHGQPARTVVVHICISSFPPPYFNGRRVLTAPNNTHAHPPRPKHPSKLQTAPKHSPSKSPGGKRMKNASLRQVFPSCQPPHNQPCNLIPRALRLLPTHSTPSPGMWEWIRVGWAAWALGEQGERVFEKVMTPNSLMADCIEIAVARVGGRS